MRQPRSLSRADGRCVSSNRQWRQGRFNRWVRRRESTRKIRYFAFFGDNRYILPASACPRASNLPDPQTLTWYPFASTALVHSAPVAESGRTRRGPAEATTTLSRTTGRTHPAPPGRPSGAATPDVAQVPPPCRATTAGCITEGHHRFAPRTADWARKVAAKSAERIHVEGSGIGT